MRWSLLAVLLVASGWGVSSDGQAKPLRLDLVLDSSEADQALVILHKQVSHEPVSEGDWQKLFATTPYHWLKERESAIGDAFTDEEFKRFLLSPGSSARENKWRDTLAAMKRANMEALGAGVLAWLPAGATIHARVFPEIKPRHNSFVWTKQGTGPAIFLYVEQQLEAKFANTVAHECHHIVANEANAKGATLATWSPELLARLNAA